MTKRNLKHLSEEDYEQCPLCIGDRLNNAFAKALNCRKCSGTGIFRKENTHICNQCGCSLLKKVGSERDCYGLMFEKII